MPGLTYRRRDEEHADRDQQRRLLAALDAAPSQLGRDDCGWWAIRGRHGAVHTYGDGASWIAYVRCRSAQHWTFTKRRLGFATLTQDGDDEGCLRLSRLPSPEEAVVIRDVLGLRKRREVSDQARAALISSGARTRFPLSKDAQILTADADPRPIPEA